MATPQYIWKEIAAGSQGPGKRSRHCLAHDTRMRATVLFSGIVWQGGGDLKADTWELRAGVWSEIDTQTSPQARHRAALIYDKSLGKSVLFGGQGDSGFGTVLDDTWTYTDGRWTRFRPASWRVPAGRCGHCLAFDEHLGAAVLFGGIGANDATLGDTWLFDGSWHPVRGAAPPARRYAGFAYDSALEGCLLYGGTFDDWGRTRLCDAWLFRDQQWLRLDDCFAPDERDDHGMAYHVKGRRLIMLEGLGGAGILARTTRGWEQLSATPLEPRRQCSPLVWNDELDGLLMHGGEENQGGPQMDATLLLCLDTAPRKQPSTNGPIAVETLIPEPVPIDGDGPGAPDPRAEKIEAAHAFLLWADAQRPRSARASCLGSLAVFAASLAIMPLLPVAWTWYWITLYVILIIPVILLLWQQYEGWRLARWCRNELVPLAKAKGVPFADLLGAVKRFESLDDQQKKQLGGLLSQGKLLSRLFTPY